MSNSLEKEVAFIRKLKYHTAYRGDNSSKADRVCYLTTQRDSFYGKRNFTSDVKGILKFAMNRCMALYEVEADDSLATPTNWGEGLWGAAYEASWKIVKTHKPPFKELRERFGEE